jgi:hypothetical protein
LFVRRVSFRVRRYAAGAVAVGLYAVAIPMSQAVASPQARERDVRHANLVQAIDGLPDYFPGFVHWRLTTDQHYGTTDWQTNTITISVLTPLSLLYSVVAHEWSHEVQLFDYRPDQVELVQQLNRHFGGAGPSGSRGVEFAADCMALLQGATWTHYTKCDNPTWRHDARVLLSGKKLPVIPAGEPNS